MKSLFRIHVISLVIYILGGFGGVSLFLFINKLFSIRLPIEWMFFVVIFCLVLSASLRLRVWKKRKNILTSEELTYFSTKIFFLIACFELLVAIVGLGIFLFA